MLINYRESNIDESEIFVNKFSLESAASQYLFFKGKKSFYIDGLWGTIKNGS
jgi:hypothetical protein